MKWRTEQDGGEERVDGHPTELQQAHQEARHEETALDAIRARADYVKRKARLHAQLA